MSYVYHNEITGMDEVRENGVTIGHIYDDPYTGRTEYRDNNCNTKAYRHGGQWRDPNTHEATRPY